MLRIAYKAGWDKIPTLTDFFLEAPLTLEHVPKYILKMLFWSLTFLKDVLLPFLNASFFIGNSEMTVDVR